MSEQSLLHREKGSNAHVIVARAWSPWSRDGQSTSFGYFKRWAGEVSHIMGRPWDRVLLEVDNTIDGPRTRYCLIWFESHRR